MVDLVLDIAYSFVVIDHKAFGMFQLVDWDYIVTH